MGLCDVPLPGASSPMGLFGSFAVLSSNRRNRTMSRPYRRTDPPLPLPQRQRLRPAAGRPGPRAGRARRRADFHTGSTRKALAERRPGGPRRRVRPDRVSRDASTAGSRRCTQRVYGGILAVRDNARNTSRDVLQTARHAVSIDMVVCNLYPFEATVAQARRDHEEIVENIDIGGPSMVRAWRPRTFATLPSSPTPAQYAKPFW